MDKEPKDVTDFIQKLVEELDLLPDDLQEKSAVFQIEINIVEHLVNNEFNSIEVFFNNKISDEDKKAGYKIGISTDKDWLLRRALYRDEEFCEKYSDFKRYLAFVRISNETLITLLSYLNKLILDYRKFNAATKPYYIHYAKIQKFLNMLEELGHEYNDLLRRIGFLGAPSPWFVNLPYPPDLRDMVSDAMIELKKGHLSIPTLRSYVEINYSIILENTLNNMIGELNTTEFEDKKILFQRSMEFDDLMSLLDTFHILDSRDIDILRRMQDYTSQSLHIGKFFDKFVGWYLLFYLTKIQLKKAIDNGKLVELVKDYANKNKLKIIASEDILRDYTRFQTQSNQMPSL